MPVIDLQKLSDGRTISYVRSTKMMSYSEANTWCTQQNGNLPIPISQKENNFLAEIGSTWLGCSTDNLESLTYTNWACKPSGDGQRCEPSGDGPHVQLLVGKRWGRDWGYGGWNDQPSDQPSENSFSTCYLAIRGENSSYIVA